METSPEIKNLKKAADRILKAVENKEKIVLYGDADLDGVSSVVILEEAIKTLNGKAPIIYFIDRENERYGINEGALAFLKKHAPALLISLDCGIGNFKEAESAKKMGFELVIIDHHEVLKKTPKASIIVDPKQKGDKYPFKELANVGITFKLSEALLKEKMSDNLRKSFLELAALATISDMMPQIKDNQILIEDGLRSIEKTWRPGLKVFWEMEEIKERVPKNEAIQKIISFLSAAMPKNHSNEAYSLLTSYNEEDARILANVLSERSLQKKMKIKIIIDEVKNKTLRKLNLPVIFEGGDSWPVPFLGPAASLICKEYQKPTFLFKKNKKEIFGAVRTPSDINGVEAMKSCSCLLEVFGGHPKAAGFTIKNKNLEKFRQCLIDYFSKL